MFNEVTVGPRDTHVRTRVNAGLEYPGSRLIPERGTPLIADAVECDLGLPPTETVAEVSAQLLSLPPLGPACPVGDFIGSVPFHARVAVVDGSLLARSAELHRPSAVEPNRSGQQRHRLGCLRFLLFGPLLTNGLLVWQKSVKPGANLVLVVPDRQSQRQRRALGIGPVGIAIAERDPVASLSRASVSRRQRADPR